MKPFWYKWTITGCNWTYWTYSKDKFYFLQRFCFFVLPERSVAKSITKMYHMTKNVSGYQVFCTSAAQPC